MLHVYNSLKGQSGAGLHTLALKWSLELKLNICKCVLWDMLYGTFMPLCIFLWSEVEGWHDGGQMFPPQLRRRLRGRWERTWNGSSFLQPLLQTPNIRLTPNLVKVAFNLPENRSCKMLFTMHSHDLPGSQNKTLGITPIRHFYSFSWNLASRDTLSSREHITFLPWSWGYCVLLITYSWKRVKLTSLGENNNLTVSVCVEHVNHILLTVYYD